MAGIDNFKCLNKVQMVVLMQLERAVIEVFGGCNYSCQMCPQTTGRGSDFTRKMPFTMFESILDQITPHGSPTINLEGSGEPTLAKDLPRYVEACTRRGLKSFIKTNGYKFEGQLLRDTIDAGLTFVRFSVIGENPTEYQKWMGIDGFDRVLENTIESRDYIAKSGSECGLSSYHLITNPENQDAQITAYLDNYINPVGASAYIWKMHNWSGNIDVGNIRTATPKRTCGRPFANEISVRAGGLGKKFAAVVPCGQTLGPPNEAHAVLGHLSDQTLEEVWNGQEYEFLRKMHADGNFEAVSYCNNCDFLYDDPEVLVWTNDPNYDVSKLMGTNIDLSKFMNN